MIIMDIFNDLRRKNGYCYLAILKHFKYIIRTVGGTEKVGLLIKHINFFLIPAMVLFYSVNASDK